jgi:hypothetical protein
MANHVLEQMGSQKQKARIQYVFCSFWVRAICGVSQAHSLNVSAKIVPVIKKLMKNRSDTFEIGVLSLHCFVDRLPQVQDLGLIENRSGFVDVPGEIGPEKRECEKAKRENKAQIRPHLIQIQSDLTVRQAII